MTGNKSCQYRGQVVNDNIISMYMMSDRVIVKHNQAKLSRLEAQTANSI